MDNTKYAKLTAKAWSQPGFVQQIFDDPQSALATVGITHGGVSASLVLIRDGKAWLNIPHKPASLQANIQDSSNAVMEDCSCHVAEEEEAG
jgi:hypothetical protein